MTTYGLTATGFVRKRLEDILEDVKTELENSGYFPTSIDLDRFPVLETFLGACLRPCADAWELAEDVHKAFDPDEATGTSQDGCCALVGVARIAESYSTATVTATGTVGTVIAAGKTVSHNVTGTRWDTLAEATIGAGGTVDISVQAQTAGVVPAIAGTLTVIETPVAGWDSVTNAADATVGRAEETDSELRLRRAQSLQVIGAGTVEAIRARLKADVEDLTEALVIENDGDVDDGDGRPPHSFEAVVAGSATAQDVADKIWEVKGAGIKAHGDNTQAVTDSMGFSHDMEYSDATEVEIWIRVELAVGSVFTEGTTQTDTVEVIDNADGDYTITINSVDFTYAAVGKTKDEIATELVSLIQNGVNPDWVPVKASTVGPLITLESGKGAEDFPGYAYSVSVNDAAKLTLTNTQAAAGDCKVIIEAIETFGATEQTIGEDVILSRYYIPVNETDDVEGITLKMNEAAGPGGPPPPPTGTSNITIAADEVANITRYQIYCVIP